MEKYIISGIQQIGVGVADVHTAWKWYRQNFGVDVKIFEEAAEASIMLPYTGGQPRKRHAALAVNLQGGGGFEIWQYTERTPEAPIFEIALGDLGIYATKMKCKNARQTHHFLLVKGEKVGAIMNDVDGKEYFFVTDPFNNIFQVVESTNWFKDEHKLTGSNCGAIIGVSNIDKALRVYTDILGYDKVVYDKTGKFDDFKEFNGGNGIFRRMLLTHSQPRKGAFAKLFGQSYIELVEAKDRTPRKIFENRLWGDLGFIHLCFDIQGFDYLRNVCIEKGFPFTVDSSVKYKETFDMGEAAGQFAYIEDPDGTLIEFVETHKVPIMKKWGIYLNLKKRNPEKHLPDFVIKAMGLNRVRD